MGGTSSIAHSRQQAILYEETVKKRNAVHSAFTLS